jgi:hypothetical protein
MALEDLLEMLGSIEQGGKGARGPNGETSGDVMDLIVKEPGGPEALVDRYGGTTNQSIANNIAFALSDLADHPAPETVNLIYKFLERIDNWDYSRTVNLLLLTVRTQTINGMAWHPPEQTPPVLSRFLTHSLALEPDDENDNADTASNILWCIQNWAEDRGGLRAVFNAEERQSFRDTFDEVGLEPGPILKALGED